MEFILPVCLLRLQNDIPGEVPLREPFLQTRLCKLGTDGKGRSDNFIEPLGLDRQTANVAMLGVVDFSGACDRTRAEPERLFPKRRYH